MTIASTSMEASRRASVTFPSAARQDLNHEPRRFSNGRRPYMSLKFRPADAELVLSSQDRQSAAWLVPRATWGRAPDIEAARTYLLRRGGECGRNGTSEPSRLPRR